MKIQLTDQPHTIWRLCQPVTPPALTPTPPLLDLQQMLAQCPELRVPVFGVAVDPGGGFGNGASLQAVAADACPGCGFAVPAPLCTSTWM
jgi:hypothetical protein